MNMAQNTDIKINLTPGSQEKSLSCHVLPCKIKFNGPISDASKYFHIDNEELSNDKLQDQIKESNPSETPIKVTHFRGRKLKGISVDLPKGYIGCLIQEGSEELPKEKGKNKYGIYEDPDEDESEVDEDMNDDNNIPLSVKSWDAVSRFSEVVVWGHETIPDKVADPYMAGFQDWVKLSHLIHDPVIES